MDAQYTGLEILLRNLDENIRHVQPYQDSLFIVLENGYKFHLRPNDSEAIRNVYRDENWDYYRTEKIDDLKHISKLEKIGKVGEYIDGLFILGEIVVDNDYEKRYEPKKSHVIADVGSNIGIPAVYFAKSIGKHGKIFCIEPDPKNTEFLEMNLEENNLKNAEIIPKAAWNIKGRKKLYVGKAPGWNSMYKIKGNVFIDGSINVDTDTIDNMIGPGKINFLKIDTEGGEIEVIRGAKETIKRTPELKVVVESHTLKGKPTYDDITFLLEKYGMQIDRCDEYNVWAEKHIKS